MPTKRNTESAERQSGSPAPQTASKVSKGLTTGAKRRKSEQPSAVADAAAGVVEIPSATSDPRKDNASRVVPLSLLDDEALARFHRQDDEHDESKVKEWFTGVVEEGGCFNSLADNNPPSSTPLQQLLPAAGSSGGGVELWFPVGLAKRASERLKAARIKRNMTVEAVAQTAGFAHANLYQEIEQGKSTAVFDKWAAVIGHFAVNLHVPFHMLSPDTTVPADLIAAAEEAEEKEKQAAAEGRRKGSAPASPTGGHHNKHFKQPQQQQQHSQQINLWGKRILFLRKARGLEPADVMYETQTCLTEIEYGHIELGLSGGEYEKWGPIIFRLAAAVSIPVMALVIDSNV